MAYIYSQIPLGTMYYDVADDTVKQDAECWQIIESTQTKTWSMDTSSVDIHETTSWRTFPNSGDWRRVGVSLLVAKLIVWALNHQAV